jgi:hypothetical protein
MSSNAFNCLWHVAASFANSNFKGEIVFKVSNITWREFLMVAYQSGFLGFKTAELKLLENTTDYNNPL